MKYFGRCTIKANGTTLDSKPGASIDIGGEKRTPVVTDVSQGYTEELVHAMIDCELMLRAGDSVRGMHFTDATVVFEADTKQRWIVKDAFTTDPPKVTGGQGIRLQIAGLAAEELVR